MTNILFVTRTDPRQTSFGGQQRSHVIWKGLKSLPNVSVSVVVPVPHKKLEFEVVDDGVFGVCLERRWSLGWILARLWSRVFPRISLSIGADAKILKSRFKPNIVVSRYIEPAARFRLWKIADLQIDVDDTPLADFDAETRVCGRSLYRKVYRVFLKIWQYRTCSHARGLWIPDQNQEADLKPYRCNLLLNIPLNCKKLDLKVEEDLVLGFVGYLKHPPNHIGLNWFLSSVWPKIVEKYPMIKLRIAGGGLDASYKSHWSTIRGVELLGFVDNLEDFYRSIDVVVAPMVMGSGTCIKVLEALSVGRAVIATEQGLRGIANVYCTEAQGIGVFHDADEFLKVIEGFFDRKRLASMSEKAYNFARVRYSQTAVNNQIFASLGAGGTGVA